jgi:hypothetical protein
VSVMNFTPASIEQPIRPTQALRPCCHYPCAPQDPRGETRKIPLCPCTQNKSAKGERQQLPALHLALAPQEAVLIPTLAPQEAVLIPTSEHIKIIFQGGSKRSHSAFYYPVTLGTVAAGGPNPGTTPLVGSPGQTFTLAGASFTEAAKQLSCLSIPVSVANTHWTVCG